MRSSLVLFQQHTELGLMCCHPNFVCPSAKTMRSKRFKRKKRTRKDESLTDTDTCPAKLMNASKFPLTDIETVLFS